MSKNVSVRRVDCLEREKNDKVAEGWAVKTQSDNVVIMSRDGGNGSLTAHVIVAIFTAWCTLGLGNLAYLGYRKYCCGEELHLKSKILKE